MEPTKNSTPSIRHTTHPFQITSVVAALALVSLTQAAPKPGLQNLFDLFHNRDGRTGGGLGDLDLSSLSLDIGEGGESEADDLTSAAADQTGNREDALNALGGAQGLASTLRDLTAIARQLDDLETALESEMEARQARAQDGDAPLATLNLNIGEAARAGGNLKGIRRLMEARRRAGQLREREELAEDSPELSEGLARLNTLRRAVAERRQSQSEVESLLGGSASASGRRNDRLFDRGVASFYNSITRLLDLIFDAVERFDIQLLQKAENLFNQKTHLFTRLSTGLLAAGSR